MNTSRSKPRFVAIDILNEILGNKKSFHELRSLGVLKNLKPSEKAFVQRLVMDTLRNLDHCDRLLEKYLKKDPKLKVRNILRLGLTELVTGGASHAIVNEAVNYAASNKTTRPMKGLVNAILRKFSSYEIDELNKDESISRLPVWLRDPLVNAYGKSTVIEIEKIQSITPPIDITLKDPSKIHDWAKELDGRIVFNESIRLESGKQISALPGFKEGDWWVQDIAASIPIRLLGNLSGKKVLDLCAAPGAKTLQLASLGANVTSVDISASRLELLRENLERCGLHADIIESDAFDIFDKFDIVLLDAPCSATGTIRRHPDLPYAKSGVGLNKLFSMQYKMLQHAVSLMKPNSQLIYCTCSLLPQEGEHQVHKLLSNFRELRVDKYLPKDLVFLEEYRTHEGGLRLLPNHFAETGGTDGFYIAKLVKV